MFGILAISPLKLNESQTIDFSDPYVLIEANFLVRQNANLHKNCDVDRQGVSIGVSERSAYDLWLSDNFKSAKIVRAPSIQASHALFWNNKVDVLASLKPKLIEEIDNREGVRLIENLLLRSNNRLGYQKGSQNSVAYINQVIRSSIQEGWLLDRLNYHGMASRLGIPVY